MGDPERYRDQKEVQTWEENDPIGIFRKYLLKEGGFDEKTLDKEEAAVEDELQEAVEFAESSPDPAPESLFEDIYVEEAV
jgi:pyruvate dehydrogenase E1 component alpha subunit